MTCRFFLTALLILSITACDRYTQFECADGLEPFNKVTLYFGMNTPEGEISDEEWTTFIDEIVTVQFPEGMTVYDSYGQWKTPEANIIREPGKVLVHLFELNTDKSAEIESVISAFKEQFDAQSVIHEQNKTCISF